MKELQMIQSVLKAPKWQFNAFGKYKYRSCEDIVEAVKPLLKAHECVLTMSDELVLIWDRYYIKATATITNKEWKQVVTTWYAREEESKKGMDSSQVTGASSSYARKYALNGLFAIDDGVDSDKTNTWESKEDDNKERISEDQIMALKDKVDRVKWFKNSAEMIAKIREKYKVSKDKAKALDSIYFLIAWDGKDNWWDDKSNDTEAWELQAKGTNAD